VFSSLPDNPRGTHCRANAACQANYDSYYHNGFDTCKGATSAFGSTLSARVSNDRYENLSRLTLSIDRRHGTLLSMGT